MAQIAGDWLPAVRAEFAKPYYRELYQFVRKEFGAEDDPYSNGMLVYQLRC